MELSKIAVVAVAVKFKPVLILLRRDGNVKSQEDVAIALHADYHVLHKTRKIVSWNTATPNWVLQYFKFINLVLVSTTEFSCKGIFLKLFSLTSLFAVVVVLHA